MKILLTLVFFVVVCSCNMRNENVKSTQSNRELLFDFDFKNDEIKVIEIVEIEHPMLGGIKDIVKLSDEQKNEFLSDIDKLEKRGLVKCGAKHIIRLITANDTLRLKVCGNLVANRSNDLYLESNNKDFLGRYLKPVHNSNRGKIR